MIPAPCPPAPPQARLKRWTRADLPALESSGVLDQQLWELIEGELIDKTGENGPRVTCLIAIVLWLHEAFGTPFVMFAGPIDFSPEDNPTNEPEPDAVVVKREYFCFARNNPRPEDLHLVVEVADSTLVFDLSTKAALYARAGIVEYWVLDINRRQLIVHRNASAGKYESAMIYGDNETVSPLAAPQAEFRPAYAFPAPLL
jgi:Uma2 family endonuclease